LVVLRSTVCVRVNNSPFEGTSESDGSGLIGSSFVLGNMFREEKNFATEVAQAA
jgi:hypothetical protein